MSDLTALPSPHDAQLDSPCSRRAPLLIPAPSLPHDTSYAPYTPRKKSRKQLREPHPGDRVVEHPHAPSLAYDNLATHPNAITTPYNLSNYLASHQPVASSKHLVDKWGSFVTALGRDGDLNHQVLDQMTVLIVTQSDPTAISHLGEEKLFYHLQDKLFKGYCPGAQVLGLLYQMLPVPYGQQPLVDASVVRLFMGWLGIEYRPTVVPEQLYEVLSRTRLHDLDNMIAIMDGMDRAGFAPVLFQWLLSLMGFLRSNNGRGHDRVSGASLAKISPYPGSRAGGDSATVPTSTNTLDTGSKAEYSRSSISPGTGKWNLWKRCFKW